MTDQIEQAQSEMNKINRPTFQVEVDDNRIAVVNILSPENDANWLPENCVEELRNVIGKAIYQQVRGILFISARPKNFIQGFKLSVLQGKTEAQLKQFSQEMQLVMRELNTLKMPAVAAIDGNCFGAGLELALACDYRIASDEVYTQFAMPQIRSGILPFSGGTQRLPRLIGLNQAADMLSSGKKVDVEHALKLGLVDMTVPANRLFEVAYQLLLENQVTKADYKKPKNFLHKWRKKLEGIPSLRNKLLDRLENRLWQRTFGNYPAVVELIELLKEPHFKQGLTFEQDTLVKLLNTELIVRQKESEIDKEILSEINKNKSSLSSKDVMIKNLTDELEKYKPTDATFAKEMQVLFPSIDDFYFGKLNLLSNKDSLQTATVLLYTLKKDTIKGKEVTKEIDAARLQQWLAEKFGDKKVICRVVD